MAGSAAERAAKRFEEKLKAAEQRATQAGGGGNDAASKASKAFEEKLRAADQGGGGGKDRNLGQQIGQIAKSPIRAGGRVLTSGPVANTLEALTVVGRGVVAGVKELDDSVVTPYERKRGDVGDGVSLGDIRGNFNRRLGAGKLTTVGQDNKWAGRAIGLVGDVALDPVSYVGFGLGAGAKAGLRKVGTEVSPEAAKAIRRYGLADAAKRGLVDADEVTAAIQRSTAAAKGADLGTKVAEREIAKLGRRGAGGMTFAGKTIIKGQSVPGRVLGAPFVLPARAAAGSAPVRAMRTALSTKAPIAAAAGDDAAALVAEAQSKARAYRDVVTYDTSREFARLIKEGKVTSKELEDVLLRNAEGVPSLDLPDRLRPFADKVREVGSSTTQDGLNAHMLSAAKLHDEATYLLRLATPAGRKRLKRTGGDPYARLSDAQQAARQGGSVLPRTFLPDAPVQVVEAELVRLHGPLPRGQKYLVHNVAKLRTARASTMAEAVALSRFADDLSRIKDTLGRPLVDLGDTKVRKAMSKEQAAAARSLSAATNEATRSSARAVKAADDLTSAQDLAVAARVQPTRRLTPLETSTRAATAATESVRVARAAASEAAAKAAAAADELTSARDLAAIGRSTPGASLAQLNRAAINASKAARATAAKADRAAARAVDKADRLTSAQDLNRVPRPVAGAPSIEPVVAAAGRATEGALPSVEQSALASAKASREAAAASAKARLAREAATSDKRIPAEAREIVKASRAERKAVAKADEYEARGEYDRLYQGNPQVARPPARKFTGVHPIYGNREYARRVGQEGETWQWWDDLGEAAQARLIRMGRVAPKGDAKGIQPDSLADYAARANNALDTPDITTEMEKWVAAVFKIDDLAQRARRDPLPFADELDEVLKRGPETRFGNPRYTVDEWEADFWRVKEALGSMPKGAPGREVFEREMADLVPPGTFEEAAGKSFEDAFDVATQLAREEAEKAFKGSTRLSASEDAVRAAVDAGDAAGLTKAQKTLYEAVVKAAKGEAADTKLGAARLKAVDRITAAVGKEAEKLATSAQAAGRRKGMVTGRAAGQSMAEAQSKRARAAQAASTESRSAQAAATRRDVLKRQVDGMEAERIVLKAPREGMVPVQVGEREVFAIPEVAEMLKKASGIMSDDESIRGFLRFYDRVLNMGKGLATVPLLGFGFHSRNAQGNIWNNFLAGVTNPAWYGRAMRIQSKLARDVPLTPREQRIFDFATERGVFSRGAQEADLAAPDALARLGGIDAGGRAKRLLSPVSDEFIPVSSGRMVGSAVENNARLAHFMWALDKTGDVERASMSVKQHLFDYADLTAIEKQGIKRFIPFWTFQRKNTPLQLVELTRQPGKFTGLGHLLEQPNEDFSLDVPPMAAVKAITGPMQPGGLASLTGLGLTGAFKSQAFGKTIPKGGTEGFQQIPAGSGSESRLDVLGADLVPLYGKYGKVSSTYRQIDEGEWLRFFLGLRRREEPAK